MRVYRIEDRGGRGAFQGLVSDAMYRAEQTRGVKFYGEDASEPRPGRHPAPCDDPGLRHMADEVCAGSPWFFGFESMAALLRWFDSEAHRVCMAELGGRVVVYEVPDEDTVTSDYQTVFRMPKATPVETLPIPTLTFA